jgi:DNA-binding CsgD family transcriptional regulator/GAF domain-containing protein
MVERRVADLIRRSHAALDTETLQHEVLRRLRTVMTVDAAFFATVDPATLLFTSAVSESPLREATPEFLANEFGTADVNKFADLARAPVPVRTLDGATGNDRSRSARYRELMAPLGLGDELRVALRSGSTVWGVLCLHREGSQLGFSDADTQLIQRVAPHVAAGLRHSTLLVQTQEHAACQAAGLVVLDAETLSISTINAAAESMLRELARTDIDRGDAAPFVVQAIARLARDAARSGNPTVPTVRLRSRVGRWLALQGSMLDGRGAADQVAVIIEPAGRSDIASLLLDAYELTRRERDVTELVLRGYSTREIVDELSISAHTVQDHLKSVFAKFGVSSRRQLVGALLSTVRA